MEKINFESKDLINDNIEILFSNAVKEVMEKGKKSLFLGCGS